MKATATARYVRGSTRKARLVVAAIKGRSVEEAAALLKFMPQHAAKDVAGVLKSAAANAENNLNLAADELRVIDARADEGPTIKRWRPRARGRVNRVFKRTCHITVKVAPVPTRVQSRPPAEEKPKRARRSTSGTATEAKPTTTRKRAATTRKKDD